MTEAASDGVALGKEQPDSVPVGAKLGGCILGVVVVLGAVCCSCGRLLGV